MNTLRTIIKENGGSVEDCEYDDFTLDSLAEYLGTCADGDNRAPVYSPACGGYHISSSVAEIHQEDEPEDMQWSLHVEGN